MAERFKYFRSQIIPSDRDTTIYWIERHDGENFDIHVSDIPDGAIVMDVTYGQPEYMQEYIKEGEIFRKV